MKSLHSALSVHLAGDLDAPAHPVLRAPPADVGVPTCDPAQASRPQTTYARPPSPCPAPKLCDAGWQPAAFSAATAVLGPDVAAHEAILDSWCVPFPPAKGLTHDAVEQPVRAFVQQLQAALAAQPDWPYTSAWLGGSAAIWRLGGLWQTQTPGDLDPIVFVTPRRGANLDTLQRDIAGAMATLHTAHFGAPPKARALAAWTQTRLTAKDGAGDVLSLRLGDAARHIDVRFVLTDARARPYDFVCNTIVCDLFDSTAWSTLPGVDTKRVLEDIRLGIWRCDHTLADASIIRVLKMHRRGLVPADSRDEAALWAQLVDVMDAGGPADTRGPQLRLAELLARETCARRTRQARQTSCLALLAWANGLVSLEAVGMPTYQADVQAQMRRMVASLVAGLDLQESTRDLMTLVQTPEGIASLSHWCAAFAAPADTLTWPDTQSPYVLTRTAVGAHTYLRLFIAELAGFVVLRLPQADARCPWPGPTSQPIGCVDNAPDLCSLPSSSRRQAAARALGDARLAAFAPAAVESDAAFAQTCADRLRKTWPRQTTGAGQAAHDAQHQAPIALAALHISDKAALTEAQRDLVHSLVRTTQHVAPLTRHLLTRIDAAAAVLTDLPCTYPEHVRLKACGEFKSIYEKYWPQTAACFADVRQSLHNTCKTWLHTAAFEGLGPVRDATAMASVMATWSAAHAMTYAPDGALGVEDMADTACTSALNGSLGDALLLATRLCDHPNDALTRALARLVASAQAAVARGDNACWRHVARHIIAQPGGVQACIQLYNLAPVPPAAWPKEVARRVVTTLPARGAQPHLRAAAAAFEALAQDEGFVRKHLDQGAWLRRLVTTPVTRIGAVRSLLALDGPVDKAIAAIIVPAMWTEPGPLTWAPAVLTGEAGRTVFAEQAGLHLWTSTTYPTLVSRWRQIFALLDASGATTTPEATRLAVRFMQRYGFLKATQSPPDDDACSFEVDITTQMARPYDSQDAALGIGYAVLMLGVHRVHEALGALTKHAPKALQHSVLAQAYMVTMTQLLDQLPGATPGRRAVCAGLALSVTRVPSIGGKLAAQACRLAEKTILICSDVGATTTAAQLLVHVHERWHMPDVGRRINALVTQYPDTHNTSYWVLTLASGLQDEEQSAVFLPLLDTRLVRTLHKMTHPAALAQPGVFLTLLSATTSALRLRQRVLAGHPMDQLTSMLRYCFAQAPDPRALQEYLLGSRLAAQAPIGTWATLWQAWCDAAPAPAQMRLRARQVMVHLGVDLNAATPHKAGEACLDIAIPLARLSCQDVSNGRFCIERWTQLVDVCVFETPKLWWLDALCQADSAQRQVLVNYIVQALVARIHQARGAHAAHNVPDEDRHLAMTLLYVLATYADELAAGDVLDAVHAALCKAGPHLEDDAASWSALVLQVLETTPDYNGRLAAFMPRLVPADRLHVGVKHSQLVSLSALRAPNILPWLQMAAPGHAAPALRALCAMEASWLQHVPGRVHSWRLGLGALLRRPGGVEAVEAFLASELAVPLTQAQPAHVLCCLFDAVWDVEGMSEAVWVGILQQMTLSVRQAQSHVPLRKLTDHMAACASSLDAPGPQRVIDAARAWQLRTRPKTALHQAARDLYDALNCQKAA